MADKAVKLTQFRSSVNEIKAYVDTKDAAITTRINNLPTSSGVSDYEQLSNLPKIEGVEVKGAKTAEDLKLASKPWVETQIGNIETLLSTI